MECAGVDVLFFEDQMTNRRILSTFMEALAQNPHLFRGKVVLEIGCSPGFMSLVALRAGAKHAIVVGRSPVYEAMKGVFEENGYRDGRDFTALNCGIEEVERLPGGFESVDVLMMDWLGDAFMYSAYLTSLISARDKWLSKDGILMPDRVEAYLAMFDDPKYLTYPIKFWDTVYGFDMTDMKELVRREAVTDSLNPRSIISDETRIAILNLRVIEKESIYLVSPFFLPVDGRCRIEGIFLYFVVSFMECHRPVAFSNSPSKAKTPWGQLILALDNPIHMDESDMVEGYIRMEMLGVENGVHKIKIETSIETNSTKRGESKTFIMF